MDIPVEANGVVTYDTRRVYSISSRIAGRLEKVYMKYAFQRIAKGQTIAQLYSPELVEAQRQLLFLIRNDPANEALVAGAKKKLQLLGLSPSQIEALITSKEVLRTVAVFSPYTGYLLPQAVTLPSTADPVTGGSDMNAVDNGMAKRSEAAISPLPAEQPFLREGDYVSAGQTLFKVGDTRGLRIDLRLPASTARAVREGDELQLILDDGKKRAAVAQLVQPFFDHGEKFSRVSVYVNDIHNLQIGQLVRATINLPEPESLWLPREAVVDLGIRQVVFVKDREVLKPRTVVTGTRTGNMIEITSGLATMDAVAANAHFLVDSESFIKPFN
jgi:multidrug efflux pump subunit AcrA (membrane-fusion protein)